MGSYLAAIWRCRYFWMSLVKNDLRTRYRRSVLGLGWSLLHPICMTIILTAVFHRFFQVQIEEYAPFVLAGVATWNYVLTVVQHGCQCFFIGESYIRQYPAPLAIYPLRKGWSSKGTASPMRGSNLKGRVRPSIHLMRLPKRQIRPVMSMKIAARQRRRCRHKQRRSSSKHHDFHIRGLSYLITASATRHSGTDTTTILC